MEMSRDELVSLVTKTFEMADDKLLEENNWCKHLNRVREILSQRHNAEIFIIDLIDKYFKENS